VQKIFVLCLFLNITNLLCAQEDKNIAAGFGLEYNMNSRSRYAGGMLLGFDFNLPVFLAPFAAGFTTTVSHNLNGFTVTEPAGLFRWYITGKGHTGWFAQAEIGLSFIREKNGSPGTLFMGGFRGGYRLPVENIFYIEPYTRLGYPFAFGIGVIGGIRFSSIRKDKTADTPVVDPADYKNGESIEDNDEDESIEDSEDESVEDGEDESVEDGEHTEEISEELKELAEETTFRLSNIQFMPDSAELLESELKIIQDIANMLKAYPGIKIEVSGHVAMAGTEGGRRVLSLQRAQAVASYLVLFGACDEANISAVGYGADRPIADNNTAAGMAANRRVEITILANK